MPFGKMTIDMEAIPEKKTRAICQLARMGDLAQMSPLVESLFKDAPLTLYCDEAVLEWAKLLPGFSKIVPINTSYWREVTTGGDLHLPTLLEKLKRTLPLNASLQRLYPLNDHPVCDAVSSLVTGAKAKTWLDARLILVRSYLRMMGADRSFNRFHLSDLWRFLTPNPSPPRLPRIRSSDAGMQFAYRTLQKLRQAGSKRIFAFILGSGGKYRRLTPEIFSEYWKRIYRLQSSGLILIGGKKEAGLAEEFSRSAFPCGQTVINLVGKCSAEELLGIFSISDLVVGVDTGPLHWAALSGSRVLGLYLGEAGYRETGPYGDGHLVLSPRCPEYPCSASRARDCGYRCLQDYGDYDTLAELFLRAAKGETDKRTAVPENLRLSISSLTDEGVDYGSFSAEESFSTLSLFKERVLEIFGLKSKRPVLQDTMLPFWDSFINLWTDQIRSMRFPAVGDGELVQRQKEEAIRRLNAGRRESLIRSRNMGNQQVHHAHSSPE